MFCSDLLHIDTRIRACVYTRTGVDNADSMLL